MGSDFSSGFLIEKTGKQRKLISYYKVTETKTAEICPYCLQPTVKHGKSMKKHDVYAVIDDQFARCSLFRWYYHCESCSNKPFYNTIKRDAYGIGDEFSCNFVEKAILYWLESDKTALYAVANEIGISKDKAYQWNDTLIKYFRGTYVTKLPSYAEIYFHRFFDKDRKARGLVCIPNYEEEKMDLISFIDDYTAEGVNLALENLGGNRLSGNSMIMFDFAKGVLNTLNKHFPDTNKFINANNLRSQLLTLLHLIPDQAETNKEALDNALPNYCDLFNPDDVREWLMRYQEVGLDDFTELLPDPKVPTEKWQYGEIIGNFYYVKFSHFSMDDIRKKIHTLQNRSVPASYESIVVKMLYGSREYKEEYKDAITKAAEKEGKTFEDILAVSFRRDQSKEPYYDY